LSLAIENHRDSGAFPRLLRLAAVAAALPASAARLAAQEGGVPAAGGGHAAGGDVFTRLYGHVIPHEIASFDLGAVRLGFYNIQIFQVLAVALMFVIFFGVRRGLEASLAGGGRMGPFTRIFSGFVLFIRDEMVVPIMGDREGSRFLPYFLFVFFFIAFQNLLGLIPHGATATASLFVTGGLAATTLALMVGGGMVVQGPGAFWKNLVPHGVPWWLVPLMFLVEVIGIIAKPFALTVRLFANMLAGHLVVLSFMGLIFYFAGQIGNLAYAVAVPSVGMAVFIMIIEGFVALLQAYIFTYLSILFVGMCLHPEH